MREQGKDWKKILAHITHKAWDPQYVKGPTNHHGEYNTREKRATNSKRHFARRKFEWTINIFLDAQIY